MRSIIRIVAVAVFAGLFVPRAASAQSYNYTGWAWNPDASYYYRKCTFVNSNIYFYVIYKPSFTKNYVFCYNPYRRRYWCVCPTRNHPKFNVNERFIDIFIAILNVSDANTVENSALPDDPVSNQNQSTQLKNAVGEPIGKISNMPTELPPG
jgi:hypothetical protein